MLAGTGFVNDDSPAQYHGMTRMGRCRKAVAGSDLTAYEPRNQHRSGGIPLMRRSLIAT